MRTGCGFITDLQFAFGAFDEHGYTSVKLTFLWALRPVSTAGSDSTYVPDYWYFYGSYPCLRHGGYYVQDLDHGPFCVYYGSASYTYASIGCRLQERPPKAA